MTFIPWTSHCECQQEFEKNMFSYPSHASPIFLRSNHTFQLLFMYNHFSLTLTQS